VPVVPRQRPPSAPLVTPPSGSILGGRSILTGRSILSAPSIRHGAAVPPPPALPPDVARHRRRAGALVLSGGRAVLRWGHRPSGRFVVPLLVIAVLLAATGAAGNYAVRATSPTVHPSAAAPSASASTDPDGQDGLGGVAPSEGNDVATDPATGTGTGSLGRPQDVVAGWAKKMAPATGIPEIALRAYGYAALKVATDKPACHLAWTTLAAIGKVESDHGREGGAQLQPNGAALPPIIGAPLDGRDGRALITDTDGGRFDHDRVFDHAIGPMQFIPRTWVQYQIDGDQDGQPDPDNINDTALAAANYLCAGGKDLATSVGWWGAIETYNSEPSYAKNVFDAANDYGVRSRSVA
jgi:membrane-bound lytic murein transglycosylase B